MEVYEIKPNGFCKGVSDAIKTIDNLITNNSTKRPIYMLGHLVHNKLIVNKYLNDITLVESNYLEFLEGIESGTVVFTAHGISPVIKEYLESKPNINIVDTTCIHVFKIHTIIDNHIKESSQNKVVVIGNALHPEVKGFLGISSRVSTYNQEETDYRDTLVVCQTTLTQNQVDLAVNNIKKYATSTTIFKSSVCQATSARQNAVIKASKLYDCYLVIGDKLSNNCNSLYQLLKKDNLVYKIESVIDLLNIDLTNINSIGVTAAASTPREVVDDVLKFLKELN